MSSNSSSSSSSGIGLFGLLGVAFVVLKLCHIIDWSWWWVTAPFWGGFVLFMVVLFVVIVFAVCAEFRKSRRTRSAS